MDTVLDQPWTTETFLAWEDRQEGRFEFDGRDVIPMTGGSIAHQRIAGNLWAALIRLLADGPLIAMLEMRLRAGARVRYPDVTVCAGPLDQTTRTLTDAVAIFEVLSDDTATTDRVDKLIDYSALPSLRLYVLLEQTAVAATVFQREPGAPWIAAAQTKGALDLPALGISLPLAELYQGLSFPG
nr:Uma2 family endonuclease [uncultured Rhodopila sp.]